MALLLVSKILTQSVEYILFELKIHINNIQ